MRDTIDMAREAGFTHPVPADGYMGLAYDRREGRETGGSLKAFEALVRADEREACAKVCRDIANQHSKCLCRNGLEKYQIDRATGALNGAMHSYDAIRARGETK